MPELRRLGRQFRSPKPLVGNRRALVSRSLDGGIPDNAVDPVIVSQWSVECDAGAKRLDRLLARVSKVGRRLEADACPAIAEREIGRMMELEGSCEIQACAGRYHPFTDHMRFGEGG